MNVAAASAHRPRIVAGDPLDTAALGLVPGTPLTRVRGVHLRAGAPMPLERSQHAMTVLASPVEAVLRVEGRRAQRRRFEAGDLILSAPELVMHLTAEADIRGIVLMCEVARLSDFARAEIGVALTGARFPDDPVVRDEALWHAAHAVHDGLVEDGPGRSLLFDSLARVFLATLVRRWGVIVPAGPIPPDGMDALRAWIEGAMAGSPHVDDMARAAGRPARRFARELRAQTGLAPLAYLRAARVARARDLIAQGLPLGTVAVRCGFADQAHLTRSFKAETGQTPSAWRRAQRG